LLSTALLASGPWQVLGPDGGDARSLAYDAHNPDHILLGTSTGQMFSSNDGGRTWSRLARLGGDEYVLDHISIDPQDSNRIYVSAWSVAGQQIGEIFRTKDGGQTWKLLPAMHGKSIRAMAMYKGDPKILVAGALDGVLPHQRWRRYLGTRVAREFSPKSRILSRSQLIPRIPIRCMPEPGTWPGKLPMRGANWQHINKGMIDDSDVFSVIVDHDNPSVVFASACSGIYKSETGGDLLREDSRVSRSRRAAPAF
jgi:hypothetical protein